MISDAWLPIGYNLPDRTKTKVVLFEGPGWQILETTGGGRALLARDSLARRWIDTDLIERGVLTELQFGALIFGFLGSGPNQKLHPITAGDSPDTISDALAFAMALKATRDHDTKSALQDAIYVEKISRLFPTYSISSRVDDDLVLGYWLTGGANVSARSFRRLSQMLTWMSEQELANILAAGGFRVEEVESPERTKSPADDKIEDSMHQVSNRAPSQAFELPGRPALSAFLSEHVIDIARNRARYKALGVDFPSAIVLHGPPGCGKTFAIETLVEFLGWPSFQIDASSVASPYIHETSRKVAEVFDKAIKAAPSVLIIDEMEAFLADREMGTGHHRVEEMAEFLRRIPEATKNEVLVVAMTNRIDMIDPAILRRGRFDHIIHVDYATEAEVLTLMQKLLSAIPKDKDVDPFPLSQQLVGRPLSDVAFVIREGARLAARAGKDRIDQGSLFAALSSSPAREREGSSQRRIGFV